MAELVGFKVLKRPSDKQLKPLVSIVIPVYNEEGLLQTSIVNLVEDMKQFDFGYEIIITENGSKDATVAIAHQLSERFPMVRVLTSPEPNYGRALKKGILEADGTYVICDEIDITDTDFYRRALRKLTDEGYDLVVGSKLHPDARDRRPPFRKLATKVINLMLRVMLDFHGTDTHGLKAFNRQKLLNVVNRCVVERDMFASEFVIRAERELRVTEIPVEIVEKRQPSINLVKRVPHVLKNIAKLYLAFRLNR